MTERDQTVGRIDFAQKEKYQSNPPIPLALNTRISLMSALMYNGERTDAELMELVDVAVRLERIVDIACRKIKANNRS